MDNNIGQIISSRRKSLNLTQEKLADMVGRSPGLIGQIERGETNPSFETLCRLKDILLFDLDSAPTSAEQPASKIVAEVDYLMNQWNIEKQMFLLEFARLLNKQSCTSCSNTEEGSAANEDCHLR